MNLHDELFERHKVLKAAKEEMQASLRQTEAQLEDLLCAIWALEATTEAEGRAMQAEAALEPPPAAVTEREIPEGFTKWNGGECPIPDGCTFDVVLDDGRIYRDRFKYAFWATDLRWAHGHGCGDDIIAYRIIEASASAASVPSDDACALPGSVEQSRDHSDDASEFSDEGYAPVIDPEPSPLIDAQTCEPVLAYPQPETLADPIWNEPEPEPTKPEADSIAKALDYYDPKAVAERERRNPFNIFKREDA